MSDFLTWLAGHDEGRLAELLRRRPDVLRGSPPPDLAAVESRLRQAHSIADALIRQPQPSLDVLSALIVLGGTTHVDRLAATLDDAGTGDHRARLLDWLRHLEEDALAWVDPDGIAHTAPLVETVLPVPTDWGLPASALLEGIAKNALHPVLDAWGIPRPTTKAATLTALADAFADPVRLAAQIERLTPRHRSLLAQGGFAWNPGSFDPHNYTERVEAKRAGLAAGLLLAPYTYSPLDAEAPAEVLRALRGHGLPFAPPPPPMAAPPVEAALVERESTAALVQLDAASLSVLDHVRGRPVKLLQRGGIGTQEVTRVAKGSKVDAVLVRLVLDAVYEAGLVDIDGPLLRWGETTTAWRDLDAGARVALLLEHWLRTPRAPTQTHDGAARPLAVAAPERRCHACADGRLAVLGEWARLEGAPEEADLAARVGWLRPFAHLSHREIAPVADAWDDGWAGGRSSRAAEPAPLVPAEGLPDLGTIADEARLLGLVGRGAATALLRVLLQGDRPALVSHIDAMLPSATGTATFGSDLTAMVVGPPTGELSALLDSCAVRESRGAAVTWRFSPASVRRALDAGETATQLTERLARVAGSGLPQPLTYLLSDVGRRHGRLRVAAARSVIRCDDEALLAEVVVDRKLRALRLRRVAPTIAVCGAGDEETLKALRGAGYLPMPETPDPPLPGQAPAPAAAGADVLELVRRRPPGVDRLGRPASRPGSPAGRTQAPGPEAPEAAAARLAGLTCAPGSVDLDPRIVTVIRRSNRVLSDHEVDTLAAAVHDGSPVRIRYRSTSSAVTDRVVSDLEVSGHHVMGWCHLRDDDRDFLLAGILSVAHP
jgi:hypothetical protein